MKHLGIGLVFLASILSISFGYSHAEMENQTNSTISVNSTAPIPVNATTSVPDNIGQQISDFIHQATYDFKQQKNETLNAIKDCREKIQNATSDMRSQVADECHKNIQSITAKYKDERQQFQQVFKRFREDVKTLRHEANDILSNSTRDNAIKHINNDVSKNGLSGLENALSHVKEMSQLHGKKGIENAMSQTNNTRGIKC